MTVVSLTINGQDVRADIAPRTHLADFLRESRHLPGTHLGCEHGVCGACTLLIDGAPARSCIAFAAACAGANVTTIEGLENDPVMVSLRAAFTAEHALQCGYCTPGMLVTARDIVLRLPSADAACIRLELAGNLCRCTGYAGIVRAIQRVLHDRQGAAPVTAPLPSLAALPSVVAKAEQPPAPGTKHRTAGPGIEQTLRLAFPRDAIWQALRDPALVAGCIPGASLTGLEDNRVTGTMDAALGPIRARFAGTATLAYGTDFTGEIAGEGQDRATATRLSGQARFAVAPDGAAASTLELTMTYALRGPLAQFARGPIVQDFAAEIMRIFVRNLEATLQGRAVVRMRRLGLFGLVWRLLHRRVGEWFGTD